jgi:hypothetical protein
MIPLRQSPDQPAGPRHRPDKYVHDVWNPDLQRLIDDRRGDMKRSGVDGDGNPLFKPISVRTIKTTTTRLLRRVLFFARDG